LFLGRTGCLVDEMGRIKFPEGFLALLKTGVVVTQGFERNLLVLPVDSFAEMVRQIAAMNQTDPMVRLLTRILLGNAHEVKIAANGKMQIPEDLRKFSNLEQEVILIGLGDYFEIWSQAGWEVQLNRMQDFDANASRFTGHTLVIRGVA
jgi:MraZ protein